MSFKVFDKGSASDDDSNDGVISTDNNDLKEHMVGVLFSRKKFTTLQKQIMGHIISAIEIETKHAKEQWLKHNYLSDSDEHYADSINDYSANPDEYCFQMLSMVYTPCIIL